MLLCRVAVVGNFSLIGYFFLNFSISYKCLISQKEVNNVQVIN